VPNFIDSVLQTDSLPVYWEAGLPSGGVGYFPSRAYAALAKRRNKAILLISFFAAIRTIA